MKTNLVLDDISQNKFLLGLVSETVSHDNGNELLRTREQVVRSKCVNDEHFMKNHSDWG